MTPLSSATNLPVLMAAIRQEGLAGELVLEHNDGVRRLHWTRGELVYLQSEVAGEQFGNYLLRQGILDFPALSELLANDEQYRLGEKVVQWGMLTLAERDGHLETLQGQVMIHALEHPVVQATWLPGFGADQLSADLHFKLDHRHFIWNTFQEAHHLAGVSDLLYAQGDWHWQGRADLLATLADLPLNPATAYALSFLGNEAISYQTFLSLGGLPEAEASRLLVTLWALGALSLVQGKLPALLPAPAPEPAPAPAPPIPLVLEPAFIPPPRPRPEPLPVPPAPMPFASDDPFRAPRSAAPPFEAPPLRREPQESQPELPGAPSPWVPALEAPALNAAAKARKLMLQARQLLLQDRTVEAIRALEQAVQLDPESHAAFDAWLLLGKLRMVNPAWSTRCIDALQTASRIRPSSAEPWAAMGEVYYRKDFKANAVACFRRALELDPSVAIPGDVDMSEVAGSTALGGKAGGSLFKRFKTILGGSDKP